MLASFQRWRHSKGYGVHSPFSYGLVTRAIRPGGYAWYGYRAIDRKCGRDAHAVRGRARLLLRLVATLRPSICLIPSDLHPAYLAAITAADPRIPLKNLKISSLVPRPSSLSTPRPFLLSFGTGLPLEQLAETLRYPDAAILLWDIPDNWAQRLLPLLPEGVIFQGRNSLLAIHHPGMQKIIYPMTLC